MTDLWIEGVVGDEHASAVLELFRTAQSAPGALDAAEPFTYTVGLVLDDDAHEFRSRFDELPKS